MANIEAQPGWADVRQLETNEFGRGGPNGNLNEHAKALVARTEYLKQQKADKSEIAQGHYEFATYALFNAGKSTLPLNCTVIINEQNNTGTGTWAQGSNQWNGITLAKSSYDPAEQAKAFTITQNNQLKKELGLEFVNLKSKYFGIYPSRNSENIIDGFNSSSTARTVLITVKPNTSYKVSKSTVTDRYSISLFKEFPLTARTTVKARMVHDYLSTNVFSGDFEFATGADEFWLAINVSNTSQEPDLFITELNSVKTSIAKETANLIPDLAKFMSLKVIYAGTTTNPLSISDNNNPLYKSIAISVDENTQYTFSKQTSDVFNIVCVVADATNKTRTYVEIISSVSQTEVTFTTPSRAVLLYIGVSVTGKTPFVQLEKGPVKTDWVNYGLTLSKNIFFENQFPVFAINAIASDVTALWKRMLAGAENSTVFIEPGIYHFSETLTIPSNCQLIGMGEVILKLTDATNLERIYWRGSNQVKACIKSEETSKNINLKNIKLVGADNYNSGWQWGWVLQGEGHTVDNCGAENINWLPVETPNYTNSGYGVGLMFYKAKKCRLVGGKYHHSGYQNMGVDNGEDVTIDGTFCGAGGRTSFQVHRNSRNIKLLNSTIRQEHTGPDVHSALTLHAQDGEYIDDVTIDNCSIYAQVEPSLTHRGGIQGVGGQERNIKITNNTIVTNNWGITGVATAQGNPEHWLISGNTIEADDYGVWLSGKNCIVKDNVKIEAVETININGTYVETNIVKDNIEIVKTP